MRIEELYEEDTPEQEGDEPAFFEYSDTAEIKASIYPLLQQKIEKLNRRATKLGLPPITLTTLGEKQRAVKGEDGLNSNMTELYYEVKIAGQAPKLEGYKFMATIQHTENGNVIRTVPGEEGNEQIKNFYDAHPNYCDHCKKVRYRNDTFIVKDEKGNLRQIGRNCLADFFRTTNPKQILFYFSMLDHFRKAVGEAEEEGMSRGIRGEMQINVKSILRIGAAMVRTYGYKTSVDKKTGDRNPDSTSSFVRTALFPPRIDRWTSQTTKDVIALGKNTTEEDSQMVDKVLEWWKSVPEKQKQDNEFMHNVQVLTTGDNVTRRDIGYVLALFPMYYRATTQAKDREQRNNRSNEHIGAVGDKIPPTKIKVTRTQLLKNNFAYNAPSTQMVHMQDEAGNAYVWFNNSQDRFEDGKEYTITGTIKKHEEFNGRKQTYLMRVKAQDPNAPPPVAKPAKKAAPVGGPVAAPAVTGDTPQVQAPAVAKPQGDNKVGKAIEYIRKTPGITKAQFVKYAVDNLDMGVNYATAMYYMPKIKAIRNGS